MAETSKELLNPNSENSYLLRLDFCLSHLLITKIISLLSFLKIEHISLSLDVTPSSSDVTNNTTDDFLIACSVFS